MSPRRKTPKIQNYISLATTMKHKFIDVSRPGLSFINLLNVDVLSVSSYKTFLKGLGCYIYLQTVCQDTTLIIRV